MLKKLIIHEGKETWKIPFLALLTQLALSAAAAAYFSLTPSLPADVEVNPGKLSIFIFYCFGIGAITLLAGLYFGIRFYKNLYTDEGYLMHTLPLPAWKLIASKAVIAAVWYYLTSLAELIILPITCIAVPKFAAMPEGSGDALREMLYIIVGSGPLELLLFFVPYTLTGCLYSVLVLFSAISLGQLFGRHKLIGSILCYLGLYTLTQTAASVFLLPPVTGFAISSVDLEMSGLTQSLSTLFHQLYLSLFLAELVLSGAAFFLCHYIMKKNLNLD